MDGMNKKSGAQPKLRQPEVGAIFGELTVLEVGYGPRGGIAGVVCRCSCGMETRPLRDNLVSGKSRRCPTCCNKTSPAKQARFPYSFVAEPHRSRLLDRIAAAISRCHNPDDGGYSRYGARGIEVWPGWRENRADFLRHLVSLSGWDDPSLEIDRIDNNRGYEPGNLRFCTHSQNALNTRRSRPDRIGTETTCPVCQKTFLRRRPRQESCSYSCASRLYWQRRNKP